MLEPLCYTYILEEGEPMYKLIKGGIKDHARRMLAGAARLGPGEQGRETTSQLMLPFQLAMGYMAIGDISRALRLLAKDCERRQPLMAWLHLWPIFDPLRTLPEFQKLIAQMQLPAR